MDSVTPVSSVGVSLAPQQERIALLDALRGLAILGIAVVNVLFFAVPVSRLTNWQWTQVSLSEGLVRCALVFFADRQFLYIFSILFGMGLALQYQRVRETGQDFTKLYVRRLLILLAFGVAHGLLLWYGDILALYSLLGFVVFGFRNRSTRTLLAGAVGAFMMPLCVQGLLLLPNPYARPASLNDLMDSVVAHIRKEASAPSADATTANVSSRGKTTPAEPVNRHDIGPEQRQAMKSVAAGINFLADDQRTYRSGILSQIILHRSFYFFVFGQWVAMTDTAWVALGLMLLGMYMFRRGLFCGSNVPRRYYQRLVIFGTISSVALQIPGILLHAMGPDTNWVHFIYFACAHLGSIGMSLAYMGIIFLLCQHSAWQKRLGPLVAVGQMSLTNYICTSFLFGLIFYGYGWGLMGRVSFPVAQLVALTVAAVLAAFSVWWLKYFQYGPLEWLWRTFTYLRVLPILRRTPG